MISRLLLLLSAVLCLGAAESPSPPITLSPAAAVKEARALVEKILSQQPAQNATNTGVLKIRDENNKTTIGTIRFQTVVTPMNWQTLYEARRTADNTLIAGLRVVHTGGAANQYFSLADPGGPAATPAAEKTLSGNEAMTPFAGSDFWLADLGLEFFHWPQQRLLKLEMRRSRSCKVLESTNPDPVKGSYSRVVSWIDNESSGIIHAEAYDFQNRLLKEFDPKDFKKVNGQWQLQEMEINNRQTDSRTRIEFDLGSK